MTDLNGLLSIVKKICDHKLMDQSRRISASILSLPSYDVVFDIKLTDKAIKDGDVVLTQKITANNDFSTSIQSHLTFENYNSDLDITINNIYSINIGKEHIVTNCHISNTIIENCEPLTGEFIYHNNKAVHVDGTRFDKYIYSLSENDLITFFSEYFKKSFISCATYAGLIKATGNNLESRYGYQLNKNDITRISEMYHQ